MSTITKNHWIELIVRSFLFATTICVQFIDKISETDVFKSISYGVIWLFFFIKMITRLIPKKIESMGNQKVFSKNHLPTGKTAEKDNKSALVVAGIWIAVNAIFWVLCWVKVLNNDIMFIISMFFAVCDLICVLFFCPFQKWIMKNKCCNTCRIYNWDFAMMFTPLIAVPSFYNYSLVLMSWIVLAHWEISHKLYPERFYEKSNDSLKCKNCKEFMCKNKLRVVRKEE